MKALSLHPYYADEIARNAKTEEYRTWQTPYRGDLLICASTFNDGPDLVRGHSICVVELYDIRKEGARDFTWLIRNPRPVEPVPVKGKLHLYDVDDALIKYFPGDYDTLREHWLSLGLIRELTPEEFDKYYAPIDEADPS